jgi:hypothetical protein
MKRSAALETRISIGQAAARQQVTTICSREDVDTVQLHTVIGYFNWQVVFVSGNPHLDNFIIFIEDPG